MAKAIMIQGTMSNVGKSLITAGLCRVFAKAGYKVAPFKSQNMALNSYITSEGLEMGRAQVMQAEACGVEPNTLMNPILLKPTNNTGSQVIVMGKPIGTMSARDYYKSKRSLIPYIEKAYNTLSENNDIIVIEGAGSPAEINLKADDIVNMGMAKMAKAPVILVGDIDRGGVFAQLIGTMDLLEPDEKKYVKGLIINKFRGDKAILQPGLDMLEQKANRSVLGVVPYVNCDIDDEDSLTERFNKNKATGLVDIAVIRLPRISNFTDFNVFQCIDGVSLRYVSYAEELGNPDIVILPGTKNTIGDMLWLRENGIEARIKQLFAMNKIIIGICGGYQMLGSEIIDLYGVENKGAFKGIGLLPIKTEFSNEKTRTRVKGRFNNIRGALKELNGLELSGYEIHMGNSYCLNNESAMNVLYDEFDFEKSKLDGLNVGNVYGTYVHGIFDNENIAGTIISAVLKNKGMDYSHIEAFNFDTYKQQQYDILANAVKENVNMDEIYKILNEGM